MLQQFYLLSKPLYQKALALLILIIAPLLIVQVNGQFKPTKVIRSSNIMVQEGKNYYMHEIKEGQTLYSVAAAYHVSQDIIKKENPNIHQLSSGSLPLGVVIRIPYVEIDEQLPEKQKDFDRYFYHVVQPQETLSSLSRQYMVHYKVIIENNPGVENNLPIGLEVRIPKPQAAAEKVTLTEPAPDTTYLYHQVRKGENTFKLANLYGLKVRDLKDANPDIGWGLDEGITIRIPIALITNTDMLQEKGETVIGDEILVDNEENLGKKEVIHVTYIEPETPINKECESYLYPHTEEVFEVAFLLPLYLNTNDTLHINDSLPFSNNDIYDVRFLEFLEGAYMAIDSLKNMGLRMNVNVFDTERNPLIVSDLFESGKLNNTDLIIGPVYSKPLQVASDYARQLSIPLVSPVSANGIGLDDNPNMFQVNSGNDIQFELVSKYLGNLQSMNIIMVQDTSSLNPVVRKSGSKIFDYLTYKVDPKDLLNGNIQFNPNLTDSLSEQAQSKPVQSMLSRDKENLVLIPSTNDIFVTDIINKLNALALYYDITVFGRPEWGTNEALELEYLYNLNVHYYTNFTNPFVNYADSLTLDFCRDYRMNWNNEPSRFSFQGFDITYYFFKALFFYGKDFTKCISCRENILNHTTFQTEFCFKKNRSGMGFENQALSIVRYDADSLAKEKISPDLPLNFLRRNPER